MALGQGMIFTGDEMRKVLRENSINYQGTNTWSDAYGAIEAQKQDALGQLGNQYSKEMLDAYVTSQKQASAIQASNLFQSYKDLALQENQQVLNDAFESYRNTYLQNKASIESNASNYMNAVNEELSNVANNYSKLGNMAWQYLPYLYEKNPEIFKNDANYNRFLVDDGTGNFRLKTMGELGADFIDEDTRSLNEKGVDFLNFIEGYNLGGSTFWDFVAEKDYDLFEWANSADPYNAGKRNVDTFRYFTGDREEGTWSPGNSAIVKSTTEDQFLKTSMGQELDAQYNALVEKFNEKPTNYDEAASLMSDIGAAQESLLKWAGTIDDPKTKELIDVTLSEYRRLYDVLNEGWHSNKSLAHITSSALNAYQNLYNKLTKQGKTPTEVTKSQAQEKAERQQLEQSAIQSLPDDAKNLTWNDFSDTMKQAFTINRGDTSSPDYSLEHAGVSLADEAKKMTWNDFWKGFGEFFKNAFS